jgi:transposase InsO family protein
LSIDSLTARRTRVVTLARAVMKEKKSHKGAFEREPDSWGDLLTADHVEATGISKGIRGEPVALNILDVFSVLNHFYPLMSKTADDACEAISHFIGKRPVGILYSDNSGELKAASKQLGIQTEFSQPGVPKTNAIIERKNQNVLTHALACLLGAGLPPRFWSFAAPCWCLLSNTEAVYGDSAWKLTHGEEFPGERIPFGAKVIYNPP